MAEGFTRPPAIVHEDGVYLDMPLDVYVRDRALSGSAFKKLAACPPDWWWEHADNELWDEPESDARALGTLVHCAVLEGLDVYKQRYAVKPEPPEGALVTCEHLQDWLRAYALERPLPLDLDPSHYSNVGKKNQSLRLSGSRDELVQRVRLLEPHAPIWDDGEEELAGREAISEKADRYVRLVEHALRSDPAYSPLLNGGLPEVTIFWTVKLAGEPVRCKARLDYLTPLGITEAKKFGQPPSGRTLEIGDPERALLRHVLREAKFYDYHVQAVHNVRALTAAAERYFAPDGAFAIHAAGDDMMERSALCRELLAAHRDKPPAFHWLFVRTPGAPSAIAPVFEQEDEFGNSNPVWEDAERRIATATGRFLDFRARFGDRLWMQSDGIVRPDIGDWPF